MNDPKDETLLARWLSGELTEAESKQLAESMDLEELDHKLKLVDKFDLPEFSAQKMWEEKGASILATDKELPAAKPIRRKPINIRTLVTIAAAAAAILLLVINVPKWLDLKAGPQLATQIGEQINHTWEADGSSVALNAESSLNWSGDWSEKRQVKLAGEAYFKIAKVDEQAFSVETSLGKVEVLGTQFNVRARKGVLQVVCYEGKVRVSRGPLKTILTAGQATALIDGAWVEQSAEGAGPTWLDGQSGFREEALLYVFEELERQYPVEVELDKEISIEGRIYTGQFPHDDINKALQLICEPMGLRYERQGKKVLIY